MALQLGQIELAVLFLLMLCLALLETPVPRWWAFPAAVLVAVQTVALRAMRLEREEFVVGAAQDPGGVDSAPEIVAVLVVPAIVAALFVVVFWHLARANARIRRPLRPSGATSPAAAARRRARGPA